MVSRSIHGTVTGTFSSINKTAFAVALCFSVAILALAGDLLYVFHPWSPFNILGLPLPVETAVLTHGREKSHSCLLWGGFALPKPRGPQLLPCPGILLASFDLRLQEGN